MLLASQQSARAKTMRISHFMLARHTRLTPSHTAVLNTYIAKRRSEVAPTVGGATDLFFITSDGFHTIADEIYEKLKVVYTDLEDCWIKGWPAPGLETADTAG